MQPQNSQCLQSALEDGNTWNFGECWKESVVTSAKWSLKSRSILGKKPKMLTLLLNLMGKFLKSFAGYHCGGVTQLGLSTMVAFLIFLMYKSREGSKYFARMHRVLFGISL